MQNNYHHSDSFQRVDLGGKLIIKVQFGDDIRCIPIHNEDITYDELVLMMQRVFNGKLTSNDEVVIKYKDEDGDLVTIFDSSDLAYAIHCSKILKLSLFVNGQPKPMETEELIEIRKELQTIRRQVDHLLDRLGTGSGPAQLAKAVNQIKLTDEVNASETKQASLPPAETKRQEFRSGGKEFDPLSSSKENSTLQAKQTTAIDKGQITDKVNFQGQPQAQPGIPVQTSAAQQHQMTYQNVARTGPQEDGRPPYSVMHQQSQPTAAAAAASSHHQSVQQPVPSSAVSHAQNPTQAGFIQQQPGYSAGPFPHQPYHQPTGTGFSQIQNPSPADFNQQQHRQQQTPNYSGPPGAQQQYAPGPWDSGRGGGYGPQTQGPVRSNQGQQQQPVQGMYSQGQGPAGAAEGQSNPYSRGPSYGVYPRPQGQFPPSS